jgi:hypothetical protein
MDTSRHTLSTLFEQLGLPSEASNVEHFIAEHRPLPPDIALAHARFWNQAQKDFLIEALDADSDWAEQVDTLDSLLRHA